MQFSGSAPPHGHKNTRIVLRGPPHIDRDVLDELFTQKSVLGSEKKSGALVSSIVNNQCMKILVQHHIAFSNSPRPHVVDAENPVPARAEGSRVVTPELVTVHDDPLRPTRTSDRSRERCISPDLGCIKQYDIGHVAP